MQDGQLLIPRLLAQTGPPDPSRWNEAFRVSNGSWQRWHPSWRYVFWNDTDLHSKDAENPDLEPFVAKHFPFFLPTWRLLCQRIMRFDVARYMWLYVYGGLYVDLDMEALRSAEPVLRGASLVLVGDDPIHENDQCRSPHGKGSPIPCGPHSMLLSALPALVPVFSRQAPP